MIRIKNDAHKMPLKKLVGEINLELKNILQIKKERFSRDCLSYEQLVNPSSSVGFWVLCDYVADLCTNAMQRWYCPEELKAQVGKCKSFVLKMREERLYSDFEEKLIDKIYDGTIVVLPIEKKAKSQPLLQKMGDAEIRNELGQLDFVGKQVVNSSGQVFTVKQFSDKTYLVLDDGKNGYDILIALRGYLSFVDKDFQAQIDKLLAPRQVYYAPMPPAPPEIDTDCIVIPNELSYMNILAEALALLKGKGDAYPTPRIISAWTADNFEELIGGRIYGNVAEEIYGQCCRTLEFKWEHKWLFGTRQLLFATQATREGFSVWMLPHSTYTGTSCGSWANVMRNVGKTIHEVWFVDHEKDNAPRVTFAKQADGRYVFMGVYEFAGEQTINKKVDGVYTYCIRTYMRVDKEYYL